MGSKETNYYRILGVSSSASTSEIKKSYRALSKVHHPDANGGNGDRMALINQAYAILSDPAKRLDYLPPVPKPKTAPIDYNFDYQAFADAKHKKSAKRRAEAKKEEEIQESWAFLWWYVLAIPLALAIVTFGGPLYKALFRSAQASPIVNQPTSTLNMPSQTPAAKASPTNNTYSQSDPTNTTNNPLSQSDLSPTENIDSSTQQQTSKQKIYTKYYNSSRQYRTEN